MPDSVPIATMLAGIARVVVGLVGTLGLGVLFAVVLPVGAMLIALYLVRAWPLTKRRP